MKKFVLTAAAVLIFFSFLAYGIFGSDRKDSEAEKSDKSKKGSSIPESGLSKSVGDIEFVFIQGGSFMMGAREGEGNNDEIPQRRVEVNQFWMSKFEITQKQYEEITGINPSVYKNIKYPVVRVNWFEAKKFCDKFGRKYNLQARLPYEAEWEYACRAGTVSKNYWGDEFDGRYAWYDLNSGYKFRPVGQKRPNAFSIFDLIGNVEEWCEDFYDDKYFRYGPVNNPHGPDSGEYRVLRGGSWISDSDDLRSSSRKAADPKNRDDTIGFRLVVISQ